MSQPGDVCGMPRSDSDRPGFLRLGEAHCRSLGYAPHKSRNFGSSRGLVSPSKGLAKLDSRWCRQLRRQASVSDHPEGFSDGNHSLPGMAFEVLRARLQM